MMCASSAKICKTQINFVPHRSWLRMDKISLFWLSSTLYCITPAKIVQDVADVHRDINYYEICMYISCFKALKSALPKTLYYMYMMVNALRCITLKAHRMHQDIDTYQFFEQKCVACIMILTGLFVSVIQSGNVLQIMTGRGALTGANSLLNWCTCVLCIHCTCIILTGVLRCVKGISVIPDLRLWQIRTDFEVVSAVHLL